jgi:hypothetical protein
VLNRRITRQRLSYAGRAVNWMSPLPDVKTFRPATPQRYRLERNASVTAK